MTVETHYDPIGKNDELVLSQSCRPTSGQEKKLPSHIPVAVGLLDASGLDIPLQLDGKPLAEG